VAVLIAQKSRAFWRQRWLHAMVATLCGFPFFSDPENYLTVEILIQGSANPLHLQLIV